MKKKLFLFIFLLFLVCGCGSSSSSNYIPKGKYLFYKMENSEGKVYLKEMLDVVDVKTDGNVEYFYVYIMSGNEGYISWNTDFKEEVTIDEEHMNFKEKDGYYTYKYDDGELIVSSEKFTWYYNKDLETFDSKKYYGHYDVIKATKDGKDVTDSYKENFYVEIYYNNKVSLFNDKEYLYNINSSYIYSSDGDDVIEYDIDKDTLTLYFDEYIIELEKD